MTVLAIDVGLTCGFALLSDDGTPVMSSNISSDEIMCSPFKRWSEEGRYDVCIEYPVQSIVSSTVRLRVAIEQIQRLFPHAATVRPGVWKSSRSGLRPIPNSGRLSPHEKDAIRIGWWYQDKIAHENKD